jgi:hypothetical protein
MLRLEPALLIAWTMATAAMSFSGVQHPLRTLFALAFLAFVPGLAVIRLARLDGHGVRLLLAVPTSLAITAFVSAVLVYAGAPSWDLGLAGLMALTLGAIALDLARPSFARERPVPRRKLDDESRQAALIHALVDGGSLSDAAAAAGVSAATLQRALERSNRLRLAVLAATHGESESAGGRAPADDRFSGERAEPA